MVSRQVSKGGLEKNAVVAQFGTQFVTQFVTNQFVIFNQLKRQTQVDRLMAGKGSKQPGKTNGRSDPSMHKLDTMLDEPRCGHIT